VRSAALTPISHKTYLSRFTDFSHAFFARDFANYLSHFRISQITITRNCHVPKAT